MVIGVDLGGTNIRAGIQHSGNIISAKKELFNATSPLEETLSQLIEFIRPLVNQGARGIGIGVPSVVDVDKGIVFNVVNIPSWKRVPLKDILETEFKIPVRVNNDVNCFILGEHKFGVARDFKNVVGVSSGTALGCGIIINSQLFNGHNCGAGEIGLLHYLDHNIEYYASGNFFEVFFNTTGEQAYRAAANGDATALAHWTEFGSHLAEALKSVIYAYDPEAIVLGGSLSKAYAFFSDAIRVSLQNFVYPESIRRLKIFQSQNENITLLGAASLIPEEVLSVKGR